MEKGGKRVLTELITQERVLLLSSNRHRLDYIFRIKGQGVSQGLREEED